MGAAGRSLFYPAVAVGGALFGLLVVSKFILPMIFETRIFFVALVFSLLVLGLLVRTLRRSGALR